MLQFIRKGMVFFYENSQLSYLDILLGSDSFSDMIRRMQYIEDIMSYDNNMLTQLTETQNEIKETTEHRMLSDFPFP